ncbi:MAG: TlpA disulfide reductase family protein [Elusimicrobiota bacterium]|nr:TlpA disulfide reductase family protein [Elusimicrobiota bacterium]
MKFTKRYIAIAFILLCPTLIAQQKPISQKQLTNPAHVHSSVVKAPPFALYDLEDNLVKSSDFEVKKVLILSFFATWCEPCLKEIKELEKLSSELDSAKIEILLVSTDKGKKESSQRVCQKAQNQIQSNSQHL